MKTFLTILISVLLAVGVSYGGYSAYNHFYIQKPIGGEIDEQGCLGPAGYSWCETRQKCLRIFEEFCPDGIATVVAGIEQSAGVKLESKGATTFGWLVGDGDVVADAEIDGVLYEAENVKYADYEKTEKYLNENAEADIYNLADGVVGGLRGYYLNYAVCDLNFRYVEMKENSQGLAEPAGDSLKIKLECGYFNKNDIAKLLLKQELKEAFGSKYDKSPSEVKISISAQDDNHARGGVTFLPGGPGEGGIFLAVKINGQWQLVFDGNGNISCDLVNRYNFPADMMEDCVG